MPDPYAVPESRPEPRQPYGKPYRQPGPSGYPRQQPGQPYQPYQPYQSYQPYPDDGPGPSGHGQRQPDPSRGTPEADSTTRTLWILGFVFAAVALLIPLVGLAGIACGAVAWKRGSRRGRAATIVAVVATVVAGALSIAYYNM